MKYISSDTNVWLDFSVIDKLDLPFLLPYVYLMHVDAIEDEMLSPVGLGEQLKQRGLDPIELTDEEFECAERFASIYKKISRYDSIALAIAKCRSITLLTGDKALRNAALEEKVQVIGSIGIIDQLWKQELIDATEYRVCLQGWLDHSDSRRLPQHELIKRLQKLNSPIEGY